MTKIECLVGPSNWVWLRKPSSMINHERAALANLKVGEAYNLSAQEARKLKPKKRHDVLVQVIESKTSPVHVVSKHEIESKRLLELLAV